MECNAAVACAVINPTACISCGVCAHLCPFGAIDMNVQTRAYEIEPALCEGCWACLSVCPTEAIAVTEKK